MNTKYLDYEGLIFLIEQIEERYMSKGSSSGASEENFSTELKIKLEGIEKNAQKNTVFSVSGQTGDILLELEDIVIRSSIGSSPASDLRELSEEFYQGLRKNRVELDGKADKSEIITREELEEILATIETGVVSVNNRTGAVTLTGTEINRTAHNRENLNSALVAVEEAIEELEVLQRGILDNIVQLQANKVNYKYVDGKLEKKVDSVLGKELSSNDFTDELKRKLEEIKSLTKMSQLENDAGYITKAESGITDLQTQVTRMRADIVSLRMNKAEKDEVPIKASDLEDDVGYLKKGMTWGEIIGL